MYIYIYAHVDLCIFAYRICTREVYICQCIYIYIKVYAYNCIHLMMHVYDVYACAYHMYIYFSNVHHIHNPHVTYIYIFLYYIDILCVYIYILCIYIYNVYIYIWLKAGGKLHIIVSYVYYMYVHIFIYIHVTHIYIDIHIHVFAICHVANTPKALQVMAAATSLYDLSARDINGQLVPLSFEGRQGRQGRQGTAGVNRLDG